MTRILAIETSCDETALALLEAKFRAPLNLQSARSGSFRVRAQIIVSQASLHARYGGVVPEVAARKHAEALTPAFIELFAQTEETPKDVDLIACVYGPGLSTSLSVGLLAAKTLSWLWKKPLVPVNHLHAHLYANFLNFSDHQQFSEPLPQTFFPALGLIVSGGHTELTLMRGLENFQRLGQTRDDAAGEAFDKVAKMMGLGYPGGPIISRYARDGNARRYNFPRPMLDSNDFDFSFSGLKTSVLYFLQDRSRKHESLSLDTRCDIAASFQEAVVDCLVEKTLRAAMKYQVKNVLLGGGVACNEVLRAELVARARQKSPQLHCWLPTPQTCTDNAEMVAVAGFYKYAKAVKKQRFLRLWKTQDVDPNAEI